MRLPPVCFAIPAMDECGTLEKTLDCIARQDYKGEISVWVCVNGPYSDYETGCAPMRIHHNELLWQHLIRNPWNLNLHPIDRFSQEKAWREKQAGVGLARQHCINAMLPHVPEESILISMDADTIFPIGYVREVVRCLQQHPHATAVNPPYFHPLSGNEMQDRAMLRYEIYLRCHLIQLMRIGSPYAFTALGSAIACRLSNYKKTGGFDSRQAGEDFYLLQKLAKMGRIALDCRAKVFPANRLSDRVPFGTGPAIKNFLDGMRGKYPVFSKKGFDAIAETYRQLPLLQRTGLSTPLTDFLDKAFPQKGGWDRLRKNYPGLANFTKAFHQKADGLRLFQFLRAYSLEHPSKDEDNLQDLWDMLAAQFPDCRPAPLPGNFRLDQMDAATLNRIRIGLEAFEERLRRPPV